MFIFNTYSGSIVRFPLYNQHVQRRQLLNLNVSQKGHAEDSNYKVKVKVYF